MTVPPVFTVMGAPPTQPPRRLEAKTLGGGVAIWTDRLGCVALFVASSPYSQMYRMHSLICTVDCSCCTSNATLDLSWWLNQRRVMLRLAHSEEALFLGRRSAPRQPVEYTAGVARATLKQPAARPCS